MLLESIYPIKKETKEELLQLADKIILICRRINLPPGVVLNSKITFDAHSIMERMDRDVHRYYDELLKEREKTKKLEAVIVELTEESKEPGDLGVKILNTEFLAAYCLSNKSNVYLKTKEGEYIFHGWKMVSDLQFSTIDKMISEGRLFEVKP